jgi:hypothetical protein
MEVHSLVEEGSPEKRNGEKLNEEEIALHRLHVVVEEDEAHHCLHSAFGGGGGGGGSIICC